MGFRDAFSALFAPRSGPDIDWVGPTFQSMILGLTAEELYRTQPHLRTVLSFVSRNVAHLGLQAFERVSETDRQRLRDDPLALLLKRPNADTTQYELIDSLVSDLGLYDVAYLVVLNDSEAPSGWSMRLIPPSWVIEFKGGSAFSVGGIVAANPNGTRVEFSAEDVIVFHGWNPGKPKSGTPPVQTLKHVLAEQVQAWSYREQVWQRGGRVGSYLTRPSGAAWSDAARERFAQDWKARWTGMGGAKAGGTPILEDGMELKRIGFSAREEEWSEVSKVALSTVASVFHVNPVMVGVLDNANFSNTKEFRKMLYSETLGPLMAMIEDRLNAFLVPRVSKADGVYLEFNIAEKLQGDFEEQASVLSSSTGAPWMTRNEARSRQNLPSVDGGDELVTPLNVLIGGQSSPQDGVTSGGGSVEDGQVVASGLSAEDLSARVAAVTQLIRAGFDPSAAMELAGLDPIKHLGLLPVTVQKPLSPDGEIDEDLVDAISKSRKAANWSSVKANTVQVSPLQSPNYSLVAQQSLERFFARQRESVLSSLGAKAPSWWDEARWNRELAADLLKVGLTISVEAAKQMLTDAGLQAESYDSDRTVKFLQAVAERRADAINATTRDQIKDVLAGNGPQGVTDPAHVFDIASGTRAATAGVTLATSFVGFAAVEAGRQTGAGRKTWLVMSSNPRPEHAAMDGETVGIDENFSNGANWPGDPVLGAEGVSGCSCEVEVVFG